MAHDAWAEKLDLDVLIGEGVEANAFNDTRLAQALDHLDAAGTDNVMFGVARHYLDESPRRDSYSVRHDTTSVKLFGRYDGDFEPQPPGRVQEGAGQTRRGDKLLV